MGLILMINKKVFYSLLNKGLFQKYSKNAGPIQEINVTYKKKQDIHILQKRKLFDVIEVDFIGRFIEEKIIFANLSNPIYTEIKLDNIKGTLFIKNNLFENVILEI